MSFAADHPWTASPRPTRRIGRSSAAFSTPKVIEYAFAALFALSVLAYFVSAAAIGRFQDAAAGVGAEAKPAVVLAENLSVNLADMDSQITASSLGNGLSWSRYLSDIDTAVAAMHQALRAAHEDSVEAESLFKVEQRLRNYYQLIGGSSVTSPDVFVGNEPLSRTTTLWASRAMRQDIIAEAQKAATLATEKLASAYAEFRGYTVFSTALALVPMALLLVLLLVVQHFFMRRTKRLINVPLFFATLAVAGFIGWFFYVEETGQATIQTAKETAFDDLGALYQAKVTAYLMKADESMWLFELRKARYEQRRLRATYARSFSEAARRLIDTAHVADFPAAIVENAAFTDPVDHAGLDAVQASLAAAAKFREAGQIDEAVKSTPVVPGLLGGELQRFGASVAERQPAYDAVSALLRYLEIDRQIRTTALGESRDKAVQLSIGSNDDSANWAFSRMDAALDRMIAADNAGFDSRFDAAMAKYATLRPLLAAVVAFAVALSCWGFWLRYREYR